MSLSIVNRTPFLPTTRDFPEEVPELNQEINRAYIDIANAVNFRTIGIYPTTKAAIAGDSWFFTSQRQETFRQVYTFTSTAPIPHGLELNFLFSFTPNTSGVFTDGTNYYGAIFGSNVAIAGQISFYVDPTNIVILSGAGAPAITSGIISLEWISQV